VYEIKKLKKRSQVTTKGFRAIIIIIIIIIIIMGARGSVVVKALCCKPDGRGFKSR
jgi:hypothetical protein